MGKKSNQIIAKMLAWILVLAVLITSVPTSGMMVNAAELTDSGIALMSEQNAQIAAEEVIESTDVLEVTAADDTVVEEAAEDNTSAEDNENSIIELEEVSIMPSNAGETGEPITGMIRKKSYNSASKTDDGSRVFAVTLNYSAYYKYGSYAEFEAELTVNNNTYAGVRDEDDFYFYDITGLETYENYNFEVSITVKYGETTDIYQDSFIEYISNNNAVNKTYTIYQNNNSANKQQLLDAYWYDYEFYPMSDDITAVLTLKGKEYPMEKNYGSLKADITGIELGTHNGTIVIKNATRSHTYTTNVTATVVSANDAIKSNRNDLYIDDAGSADMKVYLEYSVYNEYREDEWQGKITYNGVSINLTRDDGDFIGKLTGLSEGNCEFEVKLTNTTKGFTLTKILSIAAKYPEIRIADEFYLDSYDNVLLHAYINYVYGIKDSSDEFSVTAFLKDKEITLKNDGSSSSNYISDPVTGIEAGKTTIKIVCKNTTKNATYTVNKDVEVKDGSAAIRVPSYYYSVNGKTKLFVQYGLDEDTYDNCKAAAKLTIDSKEISLSEKKSYGILGSTDIELNPGEYKDVIISIEDSERGLSFERKTDVIIKPFEIAAKSGKREISRDDDYINLEFAIPAAQADQIKTGYIKSGSDRVAVLQKSSLEYMYDFSYYNLRDILKKDGALSEFSDSYYELPFSGLSDIKTSNLGFTFVKNPSVNNLDAELVMNDNKIITFADVASIIDVPYITGTSFYGDDYRHEIEDKDYIFAGINGINLNTAQFYPVLSINGKDITSAKAADIGRIGGRYRLKKTADYPNTDRSFEAEIRFETNTGYSLTYAPNYSNKVTLGGSVNPVVFFNSAAEEWHLYYAPNLKNTKVDISIQYSNREVASAAVTTDDSGDIIFKPTDISSDSEYKIPSAALGNLGSYSFTYSSAQKESQYANSIWYTETGYEYVEQGPSESFYNMTTYVQPAGTSIEYAFGGSNTSYNNNDEFEISLYRTMGERAELCGSTTAKCKVSNKNLTLEGTLKVDNPLTAGRYMVTVKDYNGRYRIGSDTPPTNENNLLLLEKGKCYQTSTSSSQDGDNLRVSVNFYHIGDLDSSKVKITFYDPITMEKINAGEVGKAGITGSTSYTWNMTYSKVLDKYKAFWMKVTYDGQLMADGYYFTESYYDRNPNRMSREYGEFINGVGSPWLSSTIRSISGLRFYRTVGVRVNGVKKYTVSIYSHRTKDFITSFQVATGDYYYFKKSDLDALLKNDANLEKPYTVVAEDNGVVYGVLRGVNLWYEDKKVENITATGIDFESKELMLQVGESMTLNPVITPANANTGRDVTYISSDTDVAAVDANGTVTAIGDGEATITATLSNGKKAECKIYVEAKLENLVWKAGVNNPVIKLGESIKIGFETVPAGATIPGKETWSIQDSSIADVVPYEGMSAAVITGKKAGTTNLKLKAGAFEIQTSITVTADVKLDLQGGSLEPGVSSTVHITDDNMIKDLPEPTRTDYSFAGWYSKPNGKGTGVTEETYITPYTFAAKEDGTKDYTLYAYWLPKTVVETVGAGLRIEGLGDQIYTGKAIKPELKIYDGNVKLVEGVDYSLTYKNNVNAWINSDSYDVRKQPTITVKGLGNYTKTFMVNFQILPKDLNDKDISIDDIAVAYNKKNQKVSPKIYYMGKALKNSDFTVEAGTRIETGVYPVVITGKGNFTGSYTMNLTIKADSKKLISKASITLSSSMKKRTYDINNPTKPQVSEQSGDVVVKLSGNTLVENRDYVLQYQNNIYPGKATIIVVGKGLYAGGTKRSGFDIQGLKLAGDVYYEVNKLTNMTYTGNNIAFDKTLLTLVDKDDNIISSDDFDIALENNKKPGTAKISLIGKNAYNGSVLNKTFKIDKYKLLENDVVIGLSAPYAKGGATQVDREVYFNGELLSEGVDYTVKFSDNKNVTENAKIIIMGKGMFAGNISKNFEVVKQDLSLLTMQAPAVAKGADITKLKLGVMDLDGKVLKAGIDYDSNITFYGDEYAAGEPLTADAISALEEGSEIFAKITALANSNYEGELITAIRIGQKDISKVTAKVKPGKSYYYMAGNELTFDPDILEIYDKGNPNPLVLNEDFEIIGASYQKNRNKGNATFIIRGINDFGGSKVVKFSIKAQEVAGIKK